MVQGSQISNLFSPVNFFKYPQPRPFSSALTHRSQENVGSLEISMEHWGIGSVQSNQPLGQLLCHGVFLWQRGWTQTKIGNGPTLSNLQKTQKVCQLGSMSQGMQCHYFRGWDVEHTLGECTCHTANLLQRHSEGKGWQSGTHNPRIHTVVGCRRAHFMYPLHSLPWSPQYDLSAEWQPPTTPDCHGCIHLGLITPTEPVWCPVKAVPAHYTSPPIAQQQGCPTTTRLGTILLSVQKSVGKFRCGLFG